MSGIGFSELIILFLIGLIVLGPVRLPRVANQLGSWLGQARRMTRVMRRQLEEELDLEQAPDIKPGSADSSDPDISPKADTLSVDPEPQPESSVVSTNERDDTFSPAHDADSIGTGVDDDSMDAPDQADAVDDSTAQELDDLADEKKEGVS